MFLLLGVAGLKDAVHVASEEIQLRLIDRARRIDSDHHGAHLGFVVDTGQIHVVCDEPTVGAVPAVAISNLG